MAPVVSSSLVHVSSQTRLESLPPLDPQCHSYEEGLNSPSAPLDLEGSPVGSASPKHPALASLAALLTQQVTSFLKDSWESYSEFLSHAPLTLDALPPNIMPIQ